jgi:zinc protease
VYSEREFFGLRATTLSRNFAPTMALLEEMLLEPRFDAAEFELAQRRVINLLQQQAADPRAIATDGFASLIYGDHILAANPLGSAASVAAITLDELRAFHATRLRPAAAALHIVGPVDRTALNSALAGLVERWRGAAPTLPAAPRWDRQRAGLYFVDVPGASQSVLSIGYLALAETDADFWPATMMNFRFGGGGFASQLMQQLREGKGYTYGIGSRFSGSTRPGPFAIASGVRSNITYEALELIKSIMEAYGPSFDTEDLQVTRDFLLRAGATSLETQRAKLGLLADMSSLGFPADYRQRRQQQVETFTVAQARALASRYLDPANMVWLVVGDASTQLARLQALGLGEPVLVDRAAQPVTGNTEAAAGQPPDQP